MTQISSAPDQNKVRKIKTAKLFCLKQFVVPAASSIFLEVFSQESYHVFISNLIISKLLQFLDVYFLFWASIFCLKVALYLIITTFEAWSDSLRLNAVATSLL